METTDTQLLGGLRRDDSTADWWKFDAIYRPILLRYTRARGLDGHDAEDVVQECLTRLTSALPRFEHNGRRGSFRCWLRTMVDRLVISAWRKKKEIAAPSAVFGELEGREESPENAFERIWHEEHVRCSLERIAKDVQPQTLEVYRKLAFEGWSIEEVCSAFGISKTNASVIKSRMTKRLRAEMDAILNPND